MIYKGSCHCGKVAYEFEGELEQLLECNCSHCSRKGYLLSFMPADKLKLLTPKEDLATYTFNKHVIQHHFCPNCGCAPLGFGKDKSGGTMAAINARCLENVDLSAIKRVPVDGRSF